MIKTLLMCVVVLATCGKDDVYTTLGRFDLTLDSVKLIETEFN